MTSIDENRTLSRTGDLAHDNKFIITVDFLFREQCIQSILRTNGKHSLDTKEITAAADGIARYPLPKDRPECVNEDGFTRAGLTGQDIESRTELYSNLLNQCKIRDAKTVQHGFPPPQRISA